jgi:hypothetical protein
MFLKKIAFLGENREETIFECQKVRLVSEFKGELRIELKLASRHFFGQHREICVAHDENVGLYVMNEEGRTIEIIRHLVDPGHAPTLAGVALAGAA